MQANYDFALKADTTRTMANGGHAYIHNSNTNTT